VSDIDLPALAAWLSANIEGVGEGPAEAEVISGGASNLTVGIRIGDRNLVVRRPPVGAFLPSANDVGREYRFYRALDATDVPTPSVFGFCDDPSVIGAPFYVMERLYGVVPHTPDALDGFDEPAGRTLSEHFADVLAGIHAIDIDAVGLGDAAKRTGYLSRQVSRWTDQWHRSKEADNVMIDELGRVLGASLPPSPPATIVHGDYRLGNVMLAADERTRIIGVLDWEMATLGDPLADVGYTLLYWGTRDRPPIHPSQSCADRPGFLSGPQLVDRYSRTSGRDVEHVTFYLVLAAFKLTIIAVGNRARQRRAGVDAPDDFTLAEWALDLWRRR
jgi:aminoglycoside phosphotransferase (APT) family kinase protein